jgi:hypothetical protein
MKTLEDFKQYCIGNMEAAGNACSASEGTSGCDEANFMSEVLKTIEHFEKLVKKDK